MADYYQILKRAVDGLSGGSREQRQAVYDKARKALLAQLQNMDPPLAASEISKQRMALEEAVRSVERDLTINSQSGDDASEQKESDATAADDKPDDSVGAPVETTSAPTVKVVSSTEDADVSEDKSTPSSTKRTAAIAATSEKEAGSLSSDKLVRRAGQDVLKNAVRDANALGAATKASVKSAQEAAEAVGEEREGDTARIEPTLGDAVVSQSKTYKREPVAPASANLPGHGDASLQDEESKSGFGRVVGLLLLAAAIGGGGYLLYENRDSLIPPDTEVDAGGADAGSQSNDAKPDAGQGSTAPKPVDTDGTEIPAKPVRTISVAPPADDDQTTTGDNQTTPAADQGSTLEPVSDTSDQTGSDPQPDAAADNTDTPPPAAPEAEVSKVQRSILYEEAGKSGEPGSANVGEVVWALEGEGESAAVVVTTSIPEQQINFSIKISKNSDGELPASHLIEISAEGASLADAKSIMSIPGLILKPTEQSRGEGLVGAAIRIDDNLHWIALTAGERETTYNMELLSLRSWIDIPIQYKSGRRAILTLEKGKHGDQLINEAIKVWGN